MVIQRILIVGLAVFLGLSLVPATQAQSAEGQETIEPSAALEALHKVEDLLRNHYYDPTFRGVDINARFAEAEQKMSKATTVEQAEKVFSEMLQGLSNTGVHFSLRPSLKYILKRAWAEKPIGDKFYITAVAKRSDAAKKGLKPGDELLSVDGEPAIRKWGCGQTPPSRILRPREVNRLVVASSGNQPREIDIRAEKEPLPGLMGLGFFDPVEMIMNGLNARSWTIEIGGSLMIWKIPVSSLLFESPARAKPGLNKLIRRARKYPALILDLRGNSGVSEAEVLAVAGALFDHDVHLADRMGSKLTPAPGLFAKTLGNDGFKGRLVVLVDSQTSRLAEILARVVQLEKRGLVIGDRTAGCVTQGQLFQVHIAANKNLLSFTWIGASDFLMSDGKSLEGAGVLPDQLLLPTVQDLVAMRDSVLLTAAASLFGAQQAPKGLAKRLRNAWHIH